MNKIPLLYTLLVLCFWSASSGSIPTRPANTSASQPTLRKVKDIVIYSHPDFYACFPSVVRLPDGEVLVAFRRAPDRKAFGEKGNKHVDPNSYLMMVRSPNGDNWDATPELIHAHPFGGSQDPCLLLTGDGTLLCASYGWTFLSEEARKSLPYPTFESGGATFLGGYLLRSNDKGKTWEGPLYPPDISPEKNFTPTGKPLPAYNRGALLETSGGKIRWAVAASTAETPRKTSVHLLESTDKGSGWEYVSTIAADSVVSFNETSLYETPQGDLVAFLRTAGLNGEACIARSNDGGKTFLSWESMGFRGHPLNALRLPDNRVLLVYGYRNPPYGIRARVLNAECTDYATAEEIVLRDDGGTTDLGYPWPVMLDDSRVLVVYYFNTGDGTRHIAGTILKMD